MNIIEALDDPQVFCPFFRGDTWQAWRTFLAVLFSLSLTDEQLAIYQQHTGCTVSPTSPLTEAWLCIGRRGGKSFILATIAVFLACFKDWRPFLGPGERGTIMIIAADRRQARVIKRFISGLLHGVPMLAQTVEDETKETIELKNNISIEIHTASFRSTRGYTLVAALCDEIGYWPVDETSSEPDVEVLNALRPGMSTVPGAMLLCASSPYARKGALWTAHQRHFGRDGDPILVWQADTRAMNSSVPQSYIDQQFADDPLRAASEYGAQFRSDLEAFVVREAVEACVGDFYEMPPSTSYTYRFFVDPAGGSGQDSFGAAVEHRYGEQVLVDAVREYRPPFSPEQVIAELAMLAKAYHCSTVVGDHWGGEFPRELFRKHGLSYEPCKRVKSDLYRDLLPLLNSKRIVLPRHDKLFNQIVSLERRVARGGHDSIDHPPDQHDDIANAVAGAAWLSFSHNGFLTDYEWVGGPVNDDAANRAWRVARFFEHVRANGGFAGARSGGGRMLDWSQMP